MLKRVLSFTLPLLTLPALIGCSKTEETQAQQPLSAYALNAVKEQPGIDTETLARHIDSFFTDSTVGETHALVVMRKGKIVAERYGENIDENTRLPGWSMTSTVTGVLIGLLVSDGLLRLDESAPVPAWQRSGDPRGEITLRQLLQMRSGLHHTEDANLRHDTDVQRMLFLNGRDNMANFAEQQPLEAIPGRKFKYSSASAIILADIAGHTLTPHTQPAIRSRAVNDYLQTRLLQPIGMRSAVAEYDAAGTFIGSSMLHAPARDWAALGEFLRNGGSVQGAQILPRSWISFMSNPSPRNRGYGAMLWLNRPQPNEKLVLFPGSGPEDIFASIGEHGQYLLISPSQDLTIVRLGKTTEEERIALIRKLAELTDLFTTH